MDPDRIAVAWPPDEPEVIVDVDLVDGTAVGFAIRTYLRDTDPDDLALVHQGQPVTAVLMRSVPTARAIDEALRQAELAADAEVAEVDIDEAVAYVRQIRGDDKRTGGRPPVPAEELVDTVVAYVAAVRAGSRSPTRDAAARIRLSPSTVATRLSRARELGLLTPTEPGRAGGAMRGVTWRKRNLDVDKYTSEHDVTWTPSGGPTPTDEQWRELGIEEADQREGSD